MEETVESNDSCVSTNKCRPIIGKATPFRINEESEINDVICSTNIKQCDGKSNKLRIHPLIKKTQKEGWLFKTDLHCFHCCHEFDSYVVRIPQSLETEVYCLRPMVFCSLSCAKTHIIEHNPFDSSVQLMLLHRIARDVHGWKGSVIPSAPSRLCLKIFGGDMDINDFRNTSSTIDSNDHVVYRIKEPPFVPLYIASESSTNDRRCESEERSKAKTNTSGSWKVQGLRRPEEVQRLPRAEPTEDNESLIERFTSVKQVGGDWESTDYHIPTVVTSQTPTTQEVSDAQNKAPSQKKNIPKLQDAPGVDTGRSHIKRKKERNEDMCTTTGNEVDLSKFIDEEEEGEDTH